MNDTHNKGATSTSPNDLNGDGYEHRDLRPAATCGRTDDRNQPPVRAERAVVVSFRSADLADPPPPDATAPTAETPVAEPQQPAERQNPDEPTRKTREIPIGNGDHVVFFGNGEVSVQNERSGAQFDKVPKIDIEEAAAAVFSRTNDWPADLREAVLVRLLRVKWGSGTGTVAR